MSLYKKSIRTIEGLLSNEFQRNLLNACFHNLEEESNPLCFNNFAYSMRELAIDILDDLAPDDEVKECSWYDEKKSHKGKPSRKQKAKYAIQGVLSDLFVDNKIILIGNVGQEPDVRDLDNGTKVANFSIATSERGYTLKNGTQVPERTEWHNLIAWKGLAEIIEKYVHKGDKLYVEGKIRTRSYDDSKGAKRYVTEIYVDQLELLSPKD